jgi:TolB-like protein
MNRLENREHEGVWDRLRRRKVVQWGIAYVAAGWGLLQGLAYVSQAFHWPEQLQRLAIILFIVGLPIALVVAWYHGDRGQQRVSGIEFSILTGLLLIGGGLFWWFGQVPEDATGTTATAAAPPATGQKTASIAVLPFVNMSPDKDNEFFADGISEELLNVLVRVDGLGVASRTSSFAYKGSELGAAAIARELKVEHILEGSVRKAGNQVRITAQLIDATDDRHLWSETYDRELTDIFAIQEEIANAIVAALKGTIGTAKADAVVTVQADTRNLEAYETYLKARELFIARKELPEATQLFEQVTKMDPEFARGWEGLAAIYSVLPSWGIVDRDYGAMTESAAKRALELDESLSMPWAAIASARQRILPIDWAANNALFDKAIAADPRNTSAYLWRSINWLNLGFFDRAVADQDRCLELDPKYLNCTRWKALALLYSDRQDEALHLFEAGVRAGFVTSHGASFVAPMLRRGDRVGALLLLRELGASPELAAVIVDALEHPGPLSPDAAALVERALAAGGSDYQGGVGAATTYMLLGQYDRIATAADFSADQLVHWPPGFEGFRNSPAYKEVLDKLGVPAYWHGHGYPPQCRAAGKDDFTCD